MPVTTAARDAASAPGPVTDTTPVARSALANSMPASMRAFSTLAVHLEQTMPSTIRVAVVVGAETGERRKGVWRVSGARVWIWG